MNSHPKAFEKDLGLKSLQCGLLPTFFFFISNFKRDNFTLSSNNLCQGRILTSAAVNFFFFFTESIYSQNNHLIPFLWKKIKYIDK